MVTPRSPGLHASSRHDRMCGMLGGPSSVRPSRVVTSPRPCVTEYEGRLSMEMVRQFRGGTLIVPKWAKPGDMTMELSGRCHPISKSRPMSMQRSRGRPHVPSAGVIVP